MENYFKFWRQLPKLVLGLLFTVFLFILIIGLNKVLIFLKAFDFSSNNGLFQSVVLVFLFFIFSSVGLKILDILILLLHKILVYFFNRKSFLKVFHWFKLDELMMTEGQIAKGIFIQNEHDLINYLYCKSWASPEGLGKIEGLKVQCEKIAEHIKEIKDPDILVHLDYSSSVSQEQVKKDSMRDDIKEVYYVIFNGCLFFIFLVINYFSWHIFIIGVVLFLIILLVLLLIIKDLKRKIAHYILIAYIDNFTVGELATVEDRESSL